MALVMTAGEVLPFSFLFPNERHRYKPDKKTGWNEYWVGFNGNIVNNLLSRKFFTPADPVIPVGYHEPLLNLFEEIIDKTKEETLLHLFG